MGGGEEPLVKGVTDYFADCGIPVFGPDKACARFEGSKHFTKLFLEKYDIPTANYFMSADYDEILAKTQDMCYPIVVKADGLCKGKGVLICQNREELEATLQSMLIEKRFGDQALNIVIEEFLDGYEESLLCFVSNNRLIPMDTACDYKKAFDNDEGPNTGGVGAYSPGNKRSVKLQASFDSILRKIEMGFNAEGLSYNGILFIGFMIKNDEAKVLEFNVRFGDPETQALLPRLESDLFVLMQKTLADELQAEDFQWSDEKTVAVVLYSKGYPDEYVTGIELSNLPYVDNEKSIIFHNGSKFSDKHKLLSNGGRVLTAVALENSYHEARKKAYDLLAGLRNEYFVTRTDIGIVKE